MNQISNRIPDEHSESVAIDTSILFHKASAKATIMGHDSNPGRALSYLRSLFV